MSSQRNQLTSEEPHPSQKVIGNPLTWPILALMPVRQPSQGPVLPSECPSDKGSSSVPNSNYMLDLRGATGIRTPDLLHAMEHPTVHHSLPQATRDPAELGIRPLQATSVHQSSPRTVTTSVTRDTRPALWVHGRSPRTVTSKPHRQATRLGRPEASGNATRISGRLPRHVVLPRAPHPASTSPAALTTARSLISQPPDTSEASAARDELARQNPGGAQCTPRRAGRTASAHATGITQPLAQPEIRRGPA